MVEINPEDFIPYLTLASISKQIGAEISTEHVARARRLIPEDDWYDRTCLESVCGKLDLAFEYLEEAAQHEQFNASSAWDDPDLQWLRSDPRFAAIVGERPARSEEA